LPRGVYLLKGDGGQFELAAGPGLADAWRVATRTFPSTPMMGACGAAAHQRRVVIVPDLQTSDLFTNAASRPRID
jgi:hypothetical protein